MGVVARVLPLLVFVVQVHRVRAADRVLRDCWGPEREAGGGLVGVVLLGLGVYLVWWAVGGLGLGDWVGVGVVGSEVGDQDQVYRAVTGLYQGG